MAQTFGYVTTISRDGRATVTAEKGQGCGSCGAASQCHRGHAAGRRTVPVLNRVGAGVGDRVALSVASGAILARMAVLYLVPVAGILIGAFVGEFGAGSSVVCALAGLAIGFVFSVTVSRIWSAAHPVLPVITRIVNRRPGAVAAPDPAGCDGSVDGRKTDQAQNGKRDSHATRDI